jgi:predicted nucleic acid-binding protein
MAVDNILIDTNAYASFKRGDMAAVEIIRSSPFIGINSTVLGELLSGFAVGNRELLNRGELETFLQSSRVKIIAVDHETAEHYAKIYKELRQKGKPIPTNDLWIAATAVQYNLTVFTYDEHFKAVSGIRTGNRLIDFIPL